jgi:hypothetical protein
VILAVGGIFLLCQARGCGNQAGEYGQQHVACHFHIRFLMVDNRVLIGLRDNILKHFLPL